MTNQKKFKTIHELEKLFGFVIPKDGMLMAMTGTPQVDITALNEKFSAHDHEYDHENCLYKGRECSCMEYVKRKYGEKTLELLNQVL